MKYLTTFGKNLGIMFICLLIGNFILTLLNYFELITGGIFSIFQIILIVLITVIGGFLIGKESKQKGWLEGLKIGLIFILIMTIINLLFIKSFSFKIILYDFILLICSMVGGILGISKKNVHIN
jgi:putative membrane protein (TIGR04086 family)